jgi:hypothetical protein
VCGFRADCRQSRCTSKAAIQRQFPVPLKWHSTAKISLASLFGQAVLCPLFLEIVSDEKSARKSTGRFECGCSTCRTANAFIKDQVTPMLYRKNIVSTRVLLQITIAMIFFVGGGGAAFAANNGIAPLLVPYNIYTIAGSPVFPTGLT